MERAKIVGKIGKKIVKKTYVQKPLTTKLSTFLVKAYNEKYNKQNNISAEGA